MKKWVLMILSIALCFSLCSCGTDYARIEYTAPEKIVSEGDRYTKTNSLLNTTEGGCRLTVSHFDGRQTLWTKDMEETETVQLEVLMTLTHGQVKFVHVDQDGNITTLLECTQETEAEEAIRLSVPMPGGRNKLKIIGYDCKNLACELIFCED